MIVAAIDIGSNACRLLITEIRSGKNNQLQFSKLNLVRIPLRLGMDVFTKGKISDERYQMFDDAMMSFSFLLKAYQVQNYRAYATSAMRNAINSKEIIQKIYKSTGIKIEIIDGQKEASLVNIQLLENVSPNSSGSFILIDVGGGSTEITVFNNYKIITQRSFEIGTLRILNNQVQKEKWNELKHFCKEIFSKKDTFIAIGIGGNINKLFSLSKNKNSEPLSITYLDKMKEKLESLSITERMERYELKIDRADVIVPALEIYLFILNHLQVSEIYVPKIGLVDGMVRELYHDISVKIR